MGVRNSALRFPRAARDLEYFLLAGSMIIVGIMMFQLKQKKKLGGTLILAFGLFCIVTAVMEIKGYFA